MSGPIKREEVFNKNVFIDPAKEAKTLNDALNVVELSLKDIAKLSMKAFKGIDPKNAEDIKKLSKALQKNKDDVKNLTDFEKEREKQLKKLKKLNSDRIGQLDELQLLSKKQAAANKDNAIINSKLSGTLEKLAASSRKLRREREGLDLTTEKNRKRLIAINKELDKNNKIILKNSDALKKQKINVGNYSESIQDAASASGLFGKILGPLAAIQGTLTALTKKDTVAKEVNTAATASMSVKQKALALTTGGLTKATKLFNFVLKKSPIFLAAAAIGALISFFTRSQKGIDAVSTSLAGLTAGFDVVLDRFQIVGEGIVQVVKGFASFDPDEISAGLDKIANAFKGITKEIKEETVIASKLKGLLIALTREQKLFEAQQSASLTRAKELNLISKDKLRTDQERIKALKEANKIEVDIAEKQLELQEKELAGAFESISADQQSLELTKAQIEFVDDLKNGRLDIATAAEKARDFTLGQSKAEEALFEIIDKIVAQEQAKQSLLDKQATTIKKLSALQVQVATKNAMALVREAQAKRQISKDDELAIQKRVDLLTEAAALEIESFRIQASANIKNEQEVAAAKLQINAKLQADIKKLLGGGQDFEAIARKQVKVVNDIEQEILQNDIDRLNRRLETEKLTEKERLRILDEIFETRKTKQQAFSEFLLTNEKLTAEERELINIKLGKSLEDIENDRVDAAKEANEEILKDEETFADKTI